MKYKQFRLLIYGKEKVGTTHFTWEVLSSFTEHQRQLAEDFNNV